MIVHRLPTVATVKRLFAVSGNQCAFEKCDLPLVDKSSGKVTGRICHINARRENGPRFDEHQTEAKNMEFDNLILMCPIHHDVIDSDVKSYTKDRLVELKKSHEEKFADSTETIEDDKANKLIQNINIESIKIGSYFSNSNVSHNQIANQIVNNNTESSKLYVLERQISSLRQLQSVYEYMLPEKLHPDMDWDDAIYDIAHRFTSIKQRIKQFLTDFTGFYETETENKLKECVGFCTEGDFGVTQNGVSNDAYEYANKLYDTFTELLTKHKEKIKEKIKNTSH